MRTLYVVLMVISMSLAYADSELISPPLPIPVEGEPISSRLIDSYKDDQRLISINSDSLKCEPARGVCGNGWCTDFPVLPSIASFNWDFSYFAHLKHNPLELSITGEVSREDTLCQRVQGILNEANPANGEVVADLNGYLYENIIMDMGGECLRILEERIELSMGNMQFSSTISIVLESEVACR